MRHGAATVVPHDSVPRRACAECDATKAGGDIRAPFSGRGLTEAARGACRRRAAVVVRRLLKARRHWRLKRPPAVGLAASTCVFRGCDSVSPMLRPHAMARGGHDTRG